MICGRYIINDLNGTGSYRIKAADDSIDVVLNLSDLLDTVFNEYREAAKLYRIMIYKEDVFISDARAEILYEMNRKELAAKTDEEILSSYVNGYNKKYNKKIDKNLLKLFI
jgi:hypothetical protein